MMKHTLLYMPAAALALSAALASCDDNFTHPPVIMPPCVDVVPNETLADIKADYWGYQSNGYAEIPMSENGDSLIFVGRVCSSDEAGNVYKNIVLQSLDANGEQVALAMSVNLKEIYKLANYGQEVAVYASGLTIGGYRNLLQFGTWDADKGEMTFMPEETFRAHVIRNHFPLAEPDKVVSTQAEISTLIAAKSSGSELERWQSRLVKIDGVEWVEAGFPYAGSGNTTRYIRDAEGNILPVRNSSSSTFSSDIIPSGKGSVTGILSYYNADWQLVLNNNTEEFVSGFGEAVAATPTEATGEGTAADPFNVTKAYNLVADGKIPSGEVYVKGTVMVVTEFSESFGNASYNIYDKDGDRILYVYRGLGVNGAKFTSATCPKAGDEVTVKGTLMSFSGSPQIGQGNSLTDGTVPTPTPTPSGTTLYSMLGESLAELPTDWTIDNGTLPEGLSYIWSWKVYQEKGYLNASAYLGSAYASEAYAISPVIDLTGVTGAAANFDHAAKFQTTLRELCGFAVREEGTTAWTALTVPAWPAAGSWTFANSGAIDLSAYDGKKIQVAFKYGSTASGADTWEIKNLAITGTK